MSMLTSLTAFGIRQVLGDGIESVVNAVQQRFIDHSQTLPKALERAHDRTWQALAVALAGDGFLDRIKVFFASGDDKGVREQVQLFLHSNAVSFDGTPAEVRGVCLTELKRLRKSGLLSPQGVPAMEVGRQAAGFRLCTAPQGMIEEAHRAVAGVADALREDYLARLPGCFARRRHPVRPCWPQLSLTSSVGRWRLTPNWLAASSSTACVSCRPRRRRCSVRSTRHSPRWAASSTRCSSNSGGSREPFSISKSSCSVWADCTPQPTRARSRSLMEQVQHQLAQLGMQRGEVRPQHSFSIRGDAERRAVKALLARFRELSRARSPRGARPAQRPGQVAVRIRRL